ncbi:MAG: exonuclease subunit SbcD [Victivallales bacterium]|jgi:exonuclease SbcD|nr:exonuclease subunit SbcD [Victivallales bacterium]
MKLLHTSDWHLGHLFCGRRRDAEFREFLNWLTNLIAEQKVDVLLIAGDIFDSGTPNNSSVGMYYDFLADVCHQTSCRCVIVTGGNHDSPSFLNAPKSLLERAFHIKVFGCATADIADEIVPIYDHDGNLSMIVGAIPYLRDADLHSSNWQESPEERDAAQCRGFREHFRQVAEYADKLRKDKPVPFVLTGHFAASGVTLVENDAVREFIGGIKTAQVEDLPPSADYVALGHIHQAQTVGRKEYIRYSGSPLPMSFTDTRPREVELIEFNGKTPAITPVLVPQSRRIITLQGPWQDIAPQIEAIRDDSAEIFCRVLTTDLDSSHLALALNSIFAADKHNYPVIAQSLLPLPCSQRESHTVEELRTLSEEQVFKLLLDRKGIVSPPERDALLDTFRQLLAEMHENSGES